MIRAAPIPDLLRFSGEVSLEELQAARGLSSLQPVADTAPTDDARERKEFQKRIGLFTGSELHKLLTSKGTIANNATSRGYIAEKAWERSTGCRVDKGGNFRETEWGNEWEASAVSAFMQATGKKVQKHGADQIFHKAKDFPFGSMLDGVIGRDEILEAKCPFNGGIHLQNIRYGNNLEWFIENRFDYYVQVQGGLWASNRKQCWFVSYDPGVSRERYPIDRVSFPNFKKNLFYTAIPRNEQFIDLLKKAVVVAELELQSFIAES